MPRPNHAATRAISTCHHCVTKAKTGHAARGDQISNHCQRFAATKAVAVEPRGEFGETCRSVG
jgi:hypothetical protein